MCSINTQATASVAASSSVDPVLRTSALLLGEGMREIFAEREACRKAGLYYGVVAVGIYAAERIACLDGMAGGVVMQRLLKAYGIWLLSTLLVLAPAILQAIGAIKD